MTDPPVRPGDPAAEQATQAGPRDDVDEVIAAWRRERPDLDVAPLAVLSRVSRLARRLGRARESAFSAHGLAAWEFDVLAALRRSGQPYRLSPGELLDATLVSSGTMTNRINRLRDRGFVVREPVPGDGRGAWVVLTAAGLEHVDAAFADLLRAERALLSGLDADARAALAGHLRQLSLLFEQAPE